MSFRYITPNEHSKHDTISAYPRYFLLQLEAPFCAEGRLLYRTFRIVTSGMPVSATIPGSGSLSEPPPSSSKRDVGCGRKVGGRYLAYGRARSNRPLATSIIFLAPGIFMLRRGSKVKAELKIVKTAYNLK
jgi:hypothetical protein